MKEQNSEKIKLATGKCQECSALYRYFGTDPMYCSEFCRTNHKPMDRKWMSDAHFKQMRVGDKYGRAKRVYVPELKKIFCSVKNTSLALGIPRAKLDKALNSRHNTVETKEHGVVTVCYFDSKDYSGY